MSDPALPDRVDVVVAGGGPAGIATALSLAGRGLAVAVVERTVYDRERLGETFPPAVRVSLARLGLGEELAATGALPSAALRTVWGGPEVREQSTLFDPHGCGWHVDRRAFDAGLARAARERGVTVVCGARIAAYERRGPSAWDLALETPAGRRGLQARFLVDATGRSAALVRRLRGTRVRCDALVGWAGFLTGAGETGGAVGGPALVEAVEEGWWYSAPLPGGRRVAMFFTDADLAPRGLPAGEAWQRALQSAIHTRRSLAGLHLAGPPQRAAAHSSATFPAGGEGWLAVGDAAAAWDPLSGSGVPRALDAGAEAGAALAAHLDGDAGALARHLTATSAGFIRYLAQRQAFYGREDRWPDAPFWSRRRISAPSPGPPPSPTLPRPVSPLRRSARLSGAAARPR